jgi:DNA polymerase elongation subunit (family B)
LSREDEWLWGWDPAPGIVSVWATIDGRAIVWRRVDDKLVREEARFRPWLVLTSLDDLMHMGRGLVDERAKDRRGRVTFEELQGPGALRYLVRAEDGRELVAAVLRGASQRLGRDVQHVRDLPPETVLALPPEEQYLTQTGRTYFRDLSFDDLHRAQIDLETTGLDPRVDRMFMVAVRGPDGRAEVLEAAGTSDDDEAVLIERLVARIRALDPDVIENHNLHGFDLPFLAHRARVLGVPLTLDRDGALGLSRRPSARGARLPGDDEGDGAQRAPSRMRRLRYTMAGRELIDTLDAVRRYDFSARDLPGHGLKAVARHFGLAREDREHVPGARVHDVYRRDPARVRRYACDDVHEAAGLARMLGGAAFALARMAPRRYERLADAGAATGVIDPMLVRAYLRSGEALPTRDMGDGTTHTGAALHLFASGVAHRVVKADVASLYPSLMRTFRIGPSRDTLGAMLSIVERLLDLRLDAKAKGKLAPQGSAERSTHEALSAAMKLVINSAYGYLGATSLTRFADVHAANEVTRRGREVLSLLCRALDKRGVTLLEADTDGVYFSVPADFTAADERRVVDEVAALLPPRVQLELEGRYAAMLSHEPKNYALMPYGTGDASRLILRGVAFRSSRAEPFGEAFLRRAITSLLSSDVMGARRAYVETVIALRTRQLSTLDVSSLVRLTKTPDEYAQKRAQKRELPYEAMLASGRPRWRVGERVRVYRATGGRAALAFDPRADEDDGALVVAGVAADPRDYDVEVYVRLLRVTFAERLVTALDPDDFAELVTDPDRPSLFARRLASARPRLSIAPWPLEDAAPSSA